MNSIEDKTSSPAISNNQFSIANVDKHVLQYSIQNPVSIWSGTAGISGIIVSSILIPSTIILTASCVLVVGSIVNFLYNYKINRKSIVDSYLKALKKEADERRDNKLEKLLQVLNYYSTRDSDLLKIIDRSKYQYSLINKKDVSVKKMIDGKLDSSELAYARFMNSFSLVQLALLDNIFYVASSLEAVRYIDTNEIARRKALIMKDNVVDDSEKVEWEQLIKREDVVLQKKKEMLDVLNKNEEAITKIDEFITKVSSIKTSQEGLSSDADLQFAIEEMDSLANRAKRIFNQ